MRIISKELANHAAVYLRGLHEKMDDVTPEFAAAKSAMRDFQDTWPTEHALSLLASFVLMRAWFQIPEYRDAAAPEGGEV